MNKQVNKVENSKDKFKKNITKIITKIFKNNNSFVPSFQFELDGFPCCLNFIKTFNNELLFLLDTNIKMKDEREYINGTLNMRFKNNITLYKEHYEIPTELEEMYATIERLLNSKFYNNQLVDDDELIFNKEFSLYLCKIMKKDPPKCYICLNYSNEYKTPCGHDVCIQCLYKSISKGAMQCGICREDLYIDYDKNINKNNNHNNDGNSDSVSNNNNNNISDSNNNGN